MSGLIGRVLIPTDKLAESLTDAGNSNGRRLPVTEAEPLNEMYLHLLREDAESAVALLKEQITENSTPLEYYLWPPSIAVQDCFRKHTRIIWN